MNPRVRLFCRFGALLTLWGLTACVNPPCAALPTSFQLNIEVDDDMAPLIQYLEVEIEVDLERWQRGFEVGDTLDDDVTSLAVEIRPEPTDVNELRLLVRAYNDMSTNRQLLGTASNLFEFSRDGCNEYFLELEEL